MQVDQQQLSACLAYNSFDIKQKMDHIIKLSITATSLADFELNNNKNWITQIKKVVLMS